MLKGSDFQLVREAVPAAAALLRYAGREPNQAGFAVCPLHGGGNERTGSMKLYQNGTWHCFGCGEGGDSITLTGKLLHLPRLEAARQLAADFHVPAFQDEAQTRHHKQKRLEAEQAREQEAQAISRFEAALNAASVTVGREINRLELQKQCYEWTDPNKEPAAEYCEAVNRLPYLENIATTLESGAVADKIEILKFLLKGVGD